MTLVYDCTEYMLANSSHHRKETETETSIRTYNFSSAARNRCSIAAIPLLVSPPIR